MDKYTPVYCLDVQKNIVGNCLLFYRKDGKGYTLNLDDAQEFTEQEAKNHVEQSNGKYRMWRKDMLVKAARMHVDENFAYAEKNKAEIKLKCRSTTKNIRKIGKR